MENQPCQYFVILEKIGEKIEVIEEELLKAPTAPDTQKDIQHLHHLKRELIFFRKQVWPLRGVINNLIKTPSKLIQETTHILLRDVYELK